MDRIGLLLFFLLFLVAARGQEDVTDAPEMFSTITPEEFTTEIALTTETTKNKTISELVQEQTDAIRKIIAEHKPPDHDFPVINKKHEVKDPTIFKAEKERQFIEELRMKCQHFFTQVDSMTTTTEGSRPTMQAFGPPIRPDFFNYRLPTMTRPKPTNTNSNGYYYIFSPTVANSNDDRTNKLTDKLETAASEDNVVTTINNDVPVAPMDNHNDNQDFYSDDNHPEANINPTTPAYEAMPQKFKYVRLEPLVLQKTLLTNGKTLFYWYRLLSNTQSFVRIPDTPEMEEVSSIAQPQNNAYQSVPLPEQYPFFVDPHTGAIIRNVQPQPTTTTESHTNVLNYNQQKTQFFINPQTGLIYQSANPQQFIYHKLSNQASTAPPMIYQGGMQPQFIYHKTATVPPATTQKTEITTTEQPKPAVPDYTVDYTQPDNVPEKYKNEYRFVVPMLLTRNRDVSKYPYQIDPYAYLQKDKRPDLMNIAVPYAPNYHIIKTLAVPKKFQQSSNDKPGN